MSIVVFGGDCLGNIEKNLYSIGVTVLLHITGRKPFTKSKNMIPKKTDLVLVLTDYLNHNTAKTVKLLAKEAEIPIVYAKRSWSSVEEKLKDGSYLKSI